MLRITTGNLVVTLRSVVIVLVSLTYIASINASEKEEAQHSAVKKLPHELQDQVKVVEKLTTMQFNAAKKVTGKNTFK